MTEWGFAWAGGRSPGPGNPTLPTPLPTSLLLLLWLKGQGLAGELEGSGTYQEQGCTFSADPRSIR